MQTICNENQCLGCMACRDICHKEAINVVDSIKAYNAYVNEELCVKCGACVSVCPNLNEPLFQQPIQWKQGWIADAGDRRESSSGGAAAAISRTFVQSGGVVFSCSFIQGQFVFRMAESADELRMFLGSKYVKSNPQGVYARLTDRLKANQRVLFIGLPCQVAAVKNWVKNSALQKNLYTVDLICHGAPSPKLLGLFLKQYGISLDRCEDIHFRVKDRFRVTDRTKAFAPVGVRDRYTIAFLNGLIYTENCYRCQFARTQRVSDITLGDSWGSELAESERKKGISLILCQTKKGKELLDHSNMILANVDIENAIRCNHQLREPFSPPKKREAFFDNLRQGKKFNSLVMRCYPKHCGKQDIKVLFAKMRIIFGGGVAHNRMDYRIVVIRAEDSV